MSTDTVGSVVPPSAENHTVRPWFLVPFEALPVPTGWAAAGFSAGCYAATLLILPEESADRFVQLGAVIWAMITYCIVAVSLGIRAALRDLDALRLQFDCSDEEFELLVRSVARQTTRGMVGAVLVGAAVSLVLAAYLTSTRVVDSELAMAWLVYPQALAQWTVVISALWVLISIALVFRRIGSHLSRVDLFDLEALAPFRNIGLRMALIIFGLFTIRALALRPDNVDYLVITSAVMLGLGTSAVLLPLWGAHVRIRAEKQRELTAIREAIRRQPARSSRGSVGLSRELLDLLEYRERVLSVREWLFDAPAFLRFLLYLGIPVLGWVGGAVVERLFDTIVGP